MVLIKHKELFGTYGKKKSVFFRSKCQIFYQDDPFMVSRASMQYLYDEAGKQYVDCISNVQHELVIIFPYLYDFLAKIKRKWFFDAVYSLWEKFMWNFRSEANDLALRLARDYTGHTDAIVIDHAYHGHVTTTMQMSPYKFDHGSSLPQPEWVHVAPCPDVYRGEYRLTDEELNNPEKLAKAGVYYSDAVRNIIEKAESNGRTVAAYFAEALQSCGGQVIPPAGYFLDVAKHVRTHGGVVVIDEVQTGFGRVGKKYWAHQLYDDGFCPDIVTMGKPMGNGFPVSAVVTTKKIADTLGGSVGYFNTYGGNPVACAAVLSVMKVIRDEHLLEHSQEMGEEFEKELNQLKKKYKCIGDVRGVGLFWGIDIVKDRATREPDQKLALALILKLRRERGILLNADGPYSNILKIKPPLCFNKQNLIDTINALDRTLAEMDQ
ncbi:aminotransferase, class III [Necator americanus]|uniref:Aminotransferase, class III n=1 Tax=Necator americanus TaxID=51031 RepID=W2TL07_NECAM|nr:aminotransferase, class III [Necator americanus]ETN82478.1 aminotransferase, class III [Necator americanus]